MSKPLTHQIIARAHQLIEDPAHWIQFWDARFKNGKFCDPWHKRAHAFCAVGAIMRAAFELTGCKSKAEELAEHIDTELQPLAPHGVVAVNDHQGHAAVLALFQKALAA
jgi:hypothetical protein